MLTLNLSIFGEKYTGMGVYAMHVRQILKRNYDVQEVIANKKLSDINIEKTIFAPYNITTGYSKTASLRRLYYLWQLPHEHELGFVYNPTHHGLLGYKNQLITIHDLIAIHYPEQHKMQYWYFKYIVPRLIKNCKGIIAVSETTKDDICQYYKVSSDFVYVVPNAMDNNTFIKDQCKDKGFLLCVGAAYQHKNIHELLSNYKFWVDKYKLVIASAKGAYREYLERVIKEHNLENNVELYGYVSDEKLAQLYRECSALVYPSKWEGFGIPPLEAMRYKKPVILSDIKIFREIYGDAVIYVTLGNHDSWEKAFQKLHNINEVADLKCKYREVMDKYSWNSNEEKIQKIIANIAPSVK